MKLSNINTILCSILLAGQLAHAEGSSLGLFVEPDLTYELGTATVDYPSPFSTSSGSASGFGLGAKLGFHFSEALFLAFDYRYSMPQYTDSSVSYDAKSISTNWGLVAGVQMPTIGMRIWGVLVLDGELDPEKSGSFDVSFKKANGYRIGTGFRLAALSVNLEYQQLKYGETLLEQIGPFSTASALNNVNLENHSWIVSLSFPLEL